jgi:hypothetical protein
MMPMSGNPAPAEPVRVELRCEHCDVTWRSADDEPCWSCGRAGVATASIIVVPG